jgi:dTDP-glucose pyrophosphorylase
MQLDSMTAFVVGLRHTIRQAMETINESFRGFALVADDSGAIVGVITDGDIRRGLLRGLTFSSPAIEVMNRSFVDVGPEVDRATVLDMMKARMIRQVPVLDAQRRLVGIHFLNDLLGTAVRPNAAVIMAGGRGQRLLPLTENCPKPMIPVAGRPILERTVLHLIGHGVRKIYLAINYLGERIESHFGNGERFGCTIEYLREEKPLGTGGALALVPDALTDPIVVMNGDQITQVDIGKLLDTHAAHGVDATMGVRHYQIEIPYGVVREEDGRLVAMQEKPSAHYLINAGIYVVEPRVLQRVPRDVEFPITGLFEQLVADQRPVAVHYIDEDWIDVGRHDDLRRATGIS